MMSQLGYGMRVYNQGLALAESAEYEDELNDSLLDGVALAGKRFDWMLRRLRKIRVHNKYINYVRVNLNFKKSYL